MDEQTREIHILMGKGFLRLRKDDRAIEEFKKCGHEEYLIERARQYLKKTSADRAFFILAAIEFKAPEDILTKCASDLFKDGAFIDAAIVFEKTGSKDKLIACGNEILKNGHEEDARQVFAKAVFLPK